MPSLRKSSRKSRTSTPYATPYDTNSPSSDSKKEKTQSSLDGWIEPPLKNPTPSFEEYGFARHGVLETMAPLGVPPSAKVKQRVRAFADPTIRRPGTGKNGNVLAGDEGVSTPEMTPAPELEREDSERQEDDEIPAALPPQDEDEDDDWVPTKSKGKSQVTKTPIRGKTPVQSRTPVHGRTPSKNGISKPVATVNSPVRQTTAPPPPDVATGAARQRIQIVINDAVTRSRVNNKPIIGTALQQLHEQSKTDVYLHEMLESIIHQTPTAEQYAAFRQCIKEAKKRIKRETKAREEEDFREGKSVPYSPHFFHRSPAFAKTTDAVSPGKSNAPTGRAEPTSTIALQSSDPTDVIMDDVPPMHVDSTADTDSVEVTPHPLATVPALAAKQSPSPHSARMSSKSPRKLRAINGNVGLVPEIDGDAESSSKAPSPVKTPDSVVGVVSDSDLSDVNEEIVQNGPPEPVQVNGNGTAAAPAMKKAKLAALRVGNGKKSRANSAKPNAKYEKKAPLTEEELAEEAEVQRRRQELAEQQPARMTYNPPTSEIRYEDEILETESLTESQLAVGPPIDTNGVRRAPQGPRSGITLYIGKRVREDNSTLPSPQLDSAASTRPSTPAIAPPPAKRLKLTNGQAARTKRSPVKNRDGPIAGIAHTGGGGSRQLGPDDNSPDSPPSESDDFCSACKGAGEFVCCETCPRVFHFLCCDPPRINAPEGSFYCHVCESKLRAAEAPALESSFLLLGPLFKQLESTNPRSFALPSNVQGYFENVSARDDGSYFEEVKKFPLAKSSGYGSYQRPDYLKTHDGDHKPILCVQCGKSSAGKRQLLKCDFCHAYWHLDCCDPPLANPPHISLEASQRDAWKCPRHVDHDLRSGLLVQNELNAFGDDDFSMLDAAPVARLARKIRKPKHPSIVEPTFSRGMRNNGLIDIINDPNDDTDDEGNYVFTPDDSRDANSKVFRVPERGIIADFFSKVKQDRMQHRREERRAAKEAARRRASPQQFAVRPIQQQQAALYLAQLAKKEQDIGLNDMSIEALCLSLTAEAPDAVISAISNNEPGPMTDAKRAELVKLRQLIDRALNA